MTETKRDPSAVDLATFYAGGSLWGTDILKVQEITKPSEMTRVPRAPEYVKGILNLRGQILTVIDLGVKLGLPSSLINDESRNIIVKSDNECIGLLVDRVGDVVVAEREKIETPPANVKGVAGRFLRGVFNTKDKLIGILDVDEVLREDN